jgi:hypothetical protein
MIELLPEAGGKHERMDDRARDAGAGARRSGRAGGALATARSARWPSATRSATRRAARAQQDIPPALRRAVLRRDERLSRRWLPERHLPRSASHPAALRRRQPQRGQSRHAVLRPPPRAAPRRAAQRGRCQLLSRAAGRVRRDSAGRREAIRPRPRSARARSMSPRRWLLVCASWAFARPTSMPCSRSSGSATSSPQPRRNNGSAKRCSACIELRRARVESGPRRMCSVPPRRKCASAGRRAPKPYAGRDGGGVRQAPPSNCRICRSAIFTIGMAAFQRQTAAPQYPRK